MNHSESLKPTQAALLGTTTKTYAGDFCVESKAGWGGYRSFLVLTFDDFNHLRSRDGSFGLHQGPTMACLLGEVILRLFAARAFESEVLSSALCPSR